MIVPDPTMPTGERVKLLDFGIAKLDSHNPDEPRTRTGTIIGTPTYMSPEQCRGASDVDDKADVYSLGIILYQLLVGRPPFTSSSEIGVVTMHLADPPPPLTEAAPHVSATFATLIMSMLSKGRADRPTMAMVAYATNTILASVGASAHAVPPAPPLPDTSEPDPPSANPSTLHRSFGQAGAGKPSLLARYQLPLVGLFIAASVALTYRILSGPQGSWQKPAPVPAKSPAIEKPATVRWSVESTPSGAEIIRQDTQQILGKTPWHGDQPAGTESVSIKLRLRGYADKMLTLSRSSDSTLQAALTPESPPRARRDVPSRPAKPTPSPRPPTQPRPPQENRSHVQKTQFIE